MQDRNHRKWYESHGNTEAKMQDMSWEAKEMRSKCRNPGNSDDCKIYDF